MPKKLYDPKAAPSGTTSNGPFMQLVDVPDGNYSGMWGNYQVTMTVGGQTVVFTTKDGINGAISVKVAVAAGVATVTF